MGFRPIVAADWHVFFRFELKIDFNFLTNWDVRINVDPRPPAHAPIYFVGSFVFADPVLAIVRNDEVFGRWKFRVWPIPD